MLLAKDAARYLCVEASLAIAATPMLRPCWTVLARRSILKPALEAGKLFIHIPKTGGTSICSLLYRHNVPHLSARFILGLYGRELASVPSFSVVRNPVERLLSAFHYLRHGGTRIMAASRFEMARLTPFSTFANFVAALEDDPRRLTYSALLPPQHHFVCDGQGRQIVDALFSLSSPSSLACLHRLLAVDPLPRLNESAHDPILLDRVTIKRIERIYRKDFELFARVSTETQKLQIQGAGHSFLQP